LTEAALSEKISESMKKIEIMSLEMIRLQTEVLHYKEDISRLKAQEHDYKKVINRLSVLIRKQKDVLQNYSQEREDLTNQLTELKTTAQHALHLKDVFRQEIMNENVSLKGQITTLTEQIQNYESKLSYAAAKQLEDIHRTESEARFSDHLKIKTKMLDDQNDLIRDLREKLGSYDSQIKRLKRDVRDTEGYLEDAKGDIHDLENQLKMKIEIERNLNELVSQLQSERTVCKNCRVQLNKNRDDDDIGSDDTVSGMMVQTSDVERLLRNQEHEISLLHSVNDKLNEDIKMLEGSYKTAEIQWKLLREENTEELAELKMKLVALETERKQLEECLKEEKVGLN
jgi:chromosome segregation ATPase